MPLYDCMLLLKPHVSKEVIMELVQRVGKHVYRRNGVLTELKSFGKIQLGYGIKKLDGRYFQGNLMQMTMMTPPSFNSELHYLNKDDRLLRWLLVKHRDFKSGVENSMGDHNGPDVSSFRRSIMSDSELDLDSSDDEKMGNVLETRNDHMGKYQQITSI